MNRDALVRDGTDNVLIAITDASGDGIAALDSTSLSLYGRVYVGTHGCSIFYGDPRNGNTRDSECGRGAARCAMVDALWRRVRVRCAA
jgi:hypothetical protein